MRPTAVSLTTPFPQANPKYCRITGYELSDLLGMTFGDLTHPEDRAVDRQRYDALVSGAAHEYSEEKRYIRKDGREVWVHVAVGIVRDDRGRPIQSVGVILDITNQKRAEDALRHSEERLWQVNQTLEQRIAERTAEAESRTLQLQRLTAELTQAEQRERYRLAQILRDHLQQLLVGARFNLGVLRRRLSDPEACRPLEQADELLDESLRTSRSLTAELSPPVLHDGCLSQVLHWLARWAREKHGLVVQVTADERANPHAQEIRVLLFQAIRELLLNIVKHARVGQARISLSRMADDQVRIVVSDEGVGFDPADKRAEQAESLAGSGLGLFSIRERLELMGGWMEIVSQPGQGTRIVLAAPCRLPDSATPAAAESPVVEDPSDGSCQQAAIRVLLADDHAVLRTGLASLLQTQPDIEVVGQAVDGRQAVEMALRLLPDVLVMDVSMPRLGGVDATRLITEKSPNVRVIGLSMHIKEDIAARMKAVGAVAYLTKSTPPETLIAAIRECLDSTTS